MPRLTLTIWLNSDGTSKEKKGLHLMLSEIWSKSRKKTGLFVLGGSDRILKQYLGSGQHH